MKVKIISMSQTGNTRKVAKALAQGFSGLGADAETVTMKKASPAEMAGADLVGFGAPCFSSRAPRPALDFIGRAPSLSGQKAFVFATSGGGPGRVLYEMTEALRSRGAEVIGGILIRGECFHPFPSILGRFPGRPDGVDLEEAAGFARATFNHLESGPPGPLPNSRKDALKPGRGFYDLLAKSFSDQDLRRSLKAPEADRDRCDQCGVCESECPSGALTLDPYPAIDDRCIRCYRCYCVCPERAVVADFRIGDLMSRVFYNAFFERWLGDARGSEKFY